MFRKEFTVKSNVSLKSSEKKKFVVLLKERYKIVDEQLNLKNEDVYLLKLTTFNDSSCEVYVVNKVPWLFDVNDKLYPTVYLLWKYPNCLYTYVMHAAILPKIQAGADLMLPGLIIDGEITVSSLGKLEKHTLCSIRLPNNRAAVAVGFTTISILDMLECGLRGKGVQIVHVVGDYLWKIGTKESVPHIPIELPRSPVEISVESLNLNDDASTTVPEKSDTEISATTTANIVDKNQEDSQASITETFTFHFLMTLKSDLKSPHDLPMLASTFYGSFLLPRIRRAGDDQRIKVQKTEFKKFLVFLQYMKSQGIIEVEERQKGVQTISSVNLMHPLFKEMMAKCFDDEREIGPSNQQNLKAADFKEMFSITAPLLPLIHKFNSAAKKGDLISSNQLRTVATDYVKKHNLMGNSEGGTQARICLDSLLSTCLNRQNEELIAWPELFKLLFARLQPCYEFKFNDGQTGVKKGKPPCITISTAKRASNKKVILVNNVSALGIEPTLLAKDLQVQMAASDTLNEHIADVVSQGPQVQVQGNKTDLGLKLLCEKYKVPKNMIKVV